MDRVDRILDSHERSQKERPPADRARAALAVELNLVTIKTSSDWAAANLWTILERFVEKLRARKQPAKLEVGKTSVPLYGGNLIDVVTAYYFTVVPKDSPESSSTLTFSWSGDYLGIVIRETPKHSKAVDSEMPLATASAYTVEEVVLSFLKNVFPS